MNANETPESCCLAVRWAFMIAGPPPAPECCARARTGAMVASLSFPVDEVVVVVLVVFVFVRTFVFVASVVFVFVVFVLVVVVFAGVIVVGATFSNTTARRHVSTSVKRHGPATRASTCQRRVRKRLIVVRTYCCKWEVSGGARAIIGLFPGRAREEGEKVRVAGAPGLGRPGVGHK